MNKIMKSKNQNQRKKRRKSITPGTLFLYVFLIFMVLFLFLAPVLRSPKNRQDSHSEDTVQNPAITEPSEDSKDTMETVILTRSDLSLSETDVYTFLQGPKAWSSRADWSGSWCDLVLADQKFSVFGCGLCDLANIYSTLTPFDCSPIDMYEYAQEVSGYTPVSGYGAIDWPYLCDTLESAGIYTMLMTKDETYEQFQANMANAISVISLVSSYNDSTYWKDVEGHYVNLWLYNSENDTVFLGDSGNPAHNRQYIPLRYVYDALKTASSFQYLVVTGFCPGANTWKHNGIDMDWEMPGYYHA